MLDDRKREAMRLLRERFLGWVTPPVRLPADHVIAEVVEAIYEMGRDDEREASADDCRVQSELDNMGD
jgi:hypothetical protein